MQVCYQLSNTKKAGMIAAVYFQQMKGYNDTMASLRHPLTDEEILGYILAGFGAEYESLVASITTCDDPISLNNFFAHLMSAEVRIQCNNYVGDIQSSANAASRQPADPHGTPPARGGFGCRGQGHGGGGRNRGRGGIKPTCQVCDKYGHDALRCHTSTMRSSPRRIATMLKTPRPRPALSTPTGTWTAAPTTTSPVTSIA
jgi:hypothetical protein